MEGQLLNVAESLGHNCLIKSDLALRLVLPAHGHKVCCIAPCIRLWCNSPFTYGFMLQCTPSSPHDADPGSRH